MLVWRFRAAPTERRIVSNDRLESAWPVHGSVLILNGVAYFSAGRSTHLDGGIFVYGVEPETGKILHKRQLQTTREEVTSGRGGPRNTPGSLNDILVSDGTDLFFFKTGLDPELNPKEYTELYPDGGVFEWSSPESIDGWGYL